jgi:hypothetical protein
MAMLLEERGSPRRMTPFGAGVDAWNYYFFVAAASSSKRQRRTRPGKHPKALPCGGLTVR